MKIIKRINFTEVIRELDYRKKLNKNTIIITDFDNTVVSYGAMAESMMQLQPDKIPDEVLTQVHKVIESGAKLAIATNRPDEGFGLATGMAQLMGNYPVFPKALEKMGVEVFGSGPLFMLEKFKKTDDAFYALKSWLLASEEDGGAGLKNSRNITIVCIGDRPNDMSFFEKLQDILDNEYPDIHFLVYKLPGFEAEDVPRSDWWSRFRRFVVRFLP